MRKFDLSKIASLEELGSVTPLHLEVEEPVIIQEPLNDPATDLSSALDELSETSAALEAIATTLDLSLSKGGMSASELHLTKMHSDYLTKRIGLESLEISNEASSTRVSQTQAALESIIDKISKVGKTIVDFLIKLYHAIIEKFSKVRDWLVNLRSHAPQKFQNMDDSDFEKKIKLDISLFKINERVSTDLFKDIHKSVDVLYSYDDSVCDELLPMMRQVHSLKNNDNYDDFRDRLLAVAKKGFAQIERVFHLSKKDGHITNIISGNAVSVEYHEVPKPSLNANSIDRIFQDPSRAHKSVSVSRNFVYNEITEVTLKSLGVDKDRAKSLERLIDQLIELYDSRKELYKLRYDMIMELDPMYKGDKHTDSTNYRLVHPVAKDCSVLCTTFTHVGQYSIDAVIAALRELTRGLNSASK